jgi:hypothetical protein
VITVPDSSMLHMSTAMTVEAWVKPSRAGTNWENIIMKGGPNTALSYLLNAYAMPTLNSSFFVSQAPSGVFAPSQLPLNTWTHLCGTFDGTTMRIYTNGVLAASQAQGGTIAPSTDPLFIGGNPYYGHNFAGSIDEVRIYNRALGVTEIQADMSTAVVSTAQAGRPPAPTGLRIVSQ